MRICEVCSATEFETVGEKAQHRFERCRACGLERIEPAPSDEELAAIYGKHYYEAWGLHGDEDAVARIKRETFRRVVGNAGDLGAGSRVLDCGAATGFLMDVAAEAGYDPYGVELSDFGASEIASRFGEDHVFRGELEKAPFEPGFAAVFMCDYLEHVRDPERVLHRARELLRPGGVVGISMPRLGSLTHRLMGMSWTHYKTEHLYYFSPSCLRQLLEKAGFGDFRCGPMWKTMSLAYLANQFRIYPHRILTVIAKTWDALPGGVKRAPFPLLMGELLAYATKRT